MVTHSSTLAWKIPRTEEPGRLQSMGRLGVGHDWVTSLSLFTSCIGEGNGNPSSVLAWRIPGTGEPGGLLSMGSRRVRHNWSDLAAAARAKIKPACKNELEPAAYMAARLQILLLWALLCRTPSTGLFSLSSVQSVFVWFSSLYAPKFNFCCHSKYHTDSRWTRSIFLLKGF